MAEEIDYEALPPNAGLAVRLFLGQRVSFVLMDPFS